MKRTTNVFLLLAVCIFACRGVEAQNETKKAFTNSLAVQPLYWLNNGYRVDYERQLKNPAHWLQLSAIGYHVEDKDLFWILWMDNDSRFNRAWGAGLEANYKWFPFERPVMYFAGGLSFSHFDVKYSEASYRFINYQENGLTYYEPEWQTRSLSQYFERLGTNLSLGFQNRPTRRFLIDGYAGICYLYSFYDKEKYRPDSYLNSLSYRGVSFTLGFRIGFRL